MALAVSTPTHLEKLKLLKSAADSEKAELNFLLTAALERVTKSKTIIKNRKIYI